MSSRAANRRRIGSSGVERDPKDRFDPGSGTAARLSFGPAMRDRLQRRSMPLLIAVTAVVMAGCGTALPSATALPALPVHTTPAEPTPESPQPTMVPVESDEPEPSDADTGSPGTPPCDVGALKASRGITEVRADERVTEVLLVAADTCSIDAYPALLLEDSGGTVLVAVSSAGPGGIDLVPGVAYTSEVRLANWCLGDPAYPVSIGIIHGIATVVVTGDSFPDEGDLPPCAHEDADPVLSGSAWQPRP
jgi:hypothetical protein